MSNRTIEGDLTFLMAVLNWAARSRDEQGRLLLDRNPLKGLRKPREKNPTRVVLDEEEYRTLLGVSRQVNWRFHVALALAHETGHRIGAIRQLRWSDIDLEAKTIRWRAKHEKTGYEHLTPVTDEAVAALEEARRMNKGTGDAPVLPAGTDASRCMGRRLGVPALAQGGDPRRPGAQARAGLALLAAQVRDRPDGPAAESALPTRGMEKRTHGPPLLSEGRRRTTQEGAGKPRKRSRLRSQSAGIKQREPDHRIP